MWNKLYCNSLLNRKSMEKENARLSQRIRKTKSSIPTNQYRSRSVRNSLTEKNWQQINENTKPQTNENTKNNSRIESTQKIKLSRSVDRLHHNTSILNLIQNSKRRIVNLKQKSIEKANQKLFEKLVTANSTVKTFRTKTLLNLSIEKQNSKPKSILFLSDQKPHSNFQPLPALNSRMQSPNRDKGSISGLSTLGLSMKQRLKRAKTEVLQISSGIKFQNRSPINKLSPKQESRIIEEIHHDN